MALILLALYLSSCAMTPTGSASGDNKAAPAASAGSPTDQASAPRQRYLFTEIRVKPGMGSAFAEFTKKETIPMLQKAGVKEIGYYSRAVLGESGDYVSVRPVTSLSVFDEPAPVVKALGEAGARAYGIRRAQMVESERRYMVQTRPELSIEPKAGEPEKLVFVTRSFIAPGRADDFESLTKSDFLPLIKKTGLKGYLVAKVGLGGNNNEYHSAVLADSFAEYEKWTEALQKEGYSKLAPKFAGIVDRRESSAYRFMPEMSLPQPMMAQNK